ncbi:hypothetical protein ACGLWP_004509 [Salmonella enterica subsp. enterica serovar Enteritidis]
MRQQLPGGVGLDDRMPSGSREPKGRPKKETRDVMTVSLHNPVRTYDTTSHHPVTGTPGKQRRRRCFPGVPAGDSLPGFFRAG